MRLTIGTRGSQLALVQANWVADRFREAHPGALVDIEVIKTTGDAVLDKPLSLFDDKGLFTREIETALREGWIDCAVHSLKDLPTSDPPGLVIAAIPEREDPRDALIVRGAVPTEDAEDLLKNLPPESVVGTSSLRRAAQILRLRPDLTIRDIRGNVDTRLRKLEEGQYNAILLACAGLRRLGRSDVISAILPTTLMLPAAGQGALAIQARDDDFEVKASLATLDHWATRQSVTCEREFLSVLGGGCHTPIAAWADVVGHNMELHGFVADDDGSRPKRDKLNANSSEPEWAARKLARKMRPAW